ncbi:putative cysteine proteinase [Trypanosoma theileri]|uniref:Putative cysteine proteinase n=1 Tax=Trypanosoma theileri TaxID=67003 RepID=A0A1X0NXC8_9TRYP|nr:putative cysteine proteinase [Trypanosoma theileri]ORC89188.1 putative cysteine proteinase [Trypanosoma theileri]
MARVQLFVVLVLFTALIVSARLTVRTGPPKPEELEGYSFDRFLHDFGKKYDVVEYMRRKIIFEQTLAKVRAHNANPKKLYVMGINHMSDWTPEEFTRINGAKPRMMRHVSRKNLQKKYRKSGQPTPKALDYRTTFPAVLTAVKDQGGCGSCWAHSATESMETHYALQSGKLFVLSQQQVSACTPNPRHCGGTGGCAGGVESLAYQYVHDIGGLSQEWANPYTGYYGQTGTCNNHTSKVVQVKNYVSLPQNDQDALLEALVHKGPISVSVDASNWATYGGGVFNGCDYSQNITINHAVQLVGYGHDDKLNVDYWIVRNSWSPDWGENGYIRLLRTEKVECGWDVNAHDGSACDGDPDTDWACGMCGILYGSTYPVMEA